MLTWNMNDQLSCKVSKWGMTSKKSKVSTMLWRANWKNVATVLQDMFSFVEHLFKRKKHAYRMKNLRSYSEGPISKYTQTVVSPVNINVCLCNYSAVLEDPCTAVVGASGGVFGLMGLFTADMVLNFRTMSRPILHGLIITVFLLYFVITASMSDGSTSHLSHLGGLVCGLFPAFLFLPDLRKERVEAWFPILGGTVILLVFITLPTYFYTTVLHQLDCES